MKSSVTLDLDVPEVTVVDFVGRKNTVAVDSGKLMLTLRDRAPVYVEGELSTLFSQSALVNLEAEMVKLSPGEQANMALTINNPFPRPLAGRLVVEGPDDDWTAAPRETPIRVPIGGATGYRFTVTVPKNTEYGNYGFFGKISEEGELIGKFIPRVNVVEPLNVERVVPSFGKHLTPVVRVHLTGQRPGNYAGEVEVVLQDGGGKSVVERVPFELSAGAATVVEARLPSGKIQAGGIY